MKRVSIGKLMLYIWMVCLLYLMRFHHIIVPTLNIFLPFSLVLITFFSIFYGWFVFLRPLTYRYFIAGWFTKVLYDWIPYMLICNILLLEYYPILSLLLSFGIIIVLLSVYVLCQRAYTNRQKSMLARKTLMIISILLAFPSIFVSSQLLLSPSYQGETMVEIKNEELNDENYQFKQVLNDNKEVHCIWKG